jgi:hypothetical protein
VICNTHSLYDHDALLRNSCIITPVTDLVAGGRLRIHDRGSTTGHGSCSSAVLDSIHSTVLPSTADASSAAATASDGRGGLLRAVLRLLRAARGADAAEPLLDALEVVGVRGRHRPREHPARARGWGGGGGDHTLGPGRIIALHDRASTSHQIH